jgi:hypothetical protein
MITGQLPFILAMPSRATKFDWYALPWVLQHSEADWSKKYD